MIITAQTSQSSYVGIKSCRFAGECVSCVHAWMYIRTYSTALRQRHTRATLDTRASTTRHSILASNAQNSSASRVKITRE